ncbi:MAG: hypothetical protein KBC96_08735 [Armatimonadetes bacterium]|nr:hypothetical protein [Armatimonadota bacterium]
MRNDSRKDRGAILVLAAVLLIALIGAAALAVDLGRLRLGQARAQDVCDAAALGTAWLLEPTDIESTVARISDTADELARANNQSDNRKVLKEGLDQEGVTVTRVEGKSVRLRGEVKVNFGFARILGPGPEFRTGRVGAGSKAILESARGFPYKFAPLAVTQMQVMDPDFANGRNQKLSSRYYKTDGTPDQINNLHPVGAEADFASQLGVFGKEIALATRKQLPRIEKDMSAPIVSNLSERVNGDTWTWEQWSAASDDDKATSSRIVIMPVVDNSMTVVGFTGFFVETVGLYVDTRNDRHCAAVWGHFVPGVVGATSSVHWLRPFEDFDQPWLNPFQEDMGNLMYRVRLSK